MQDPQHAAVVAHRLAERVKELTALRQAARILTDSSATAPDLLDSIARILPPAFQFPDITEAAASHAGTVGATPGYGDFPWKLRSSFRTRDGAEGTIDVMYREARPESDEGPFLAEERHLLDALAEMLQSALNQRLVEDRIRLLLDLTSAVTSELDLGDLLRTISKLLREEIRHHFASVILWDEQEGVLRRHALVFADGTGSIREGVPVSTDRSAKTVPRAERFRRSAKVLLRMKLGCSVAPSAEPGEADISADAGMPSDARGLQSVLQIRGAQREQIVPPGINEGEVTW